VAATAGLAFNPSDPKGETTRKTGDEPVFLAFLFRKASLLSLRSPNSVYRGSILTSVVFSPREAMKNRIPTLLVAEDDENDFLFLGLAFSKANVQIDLRRVSNGDEAIEYLGGENHFADRAVHPLPRMIVLDLKMPSADGFDVLVWLRNQENLKNLPAVVLSNSDYPGDIEQARALGAKGYLVKPAGCEGYASVVQKLLNLWSDATGGGPLSK
jgi:CheY-like chemotaxis protein